MPTRPDGRRRILRYQPWLNEILSIENNSLPAGRELFFIQGLFFV